MASFQPGSRPKRQSNGSSTNRVRLVPMWRRKQNRSEEPCDITLDDICSEADTAGPIPNLAFPLGTELGNLASNDKYQEEVARTSSSLLIGRQEAETEVIINRLICRHDNVDNALLFVLSNLDKEAKILILVNNLIHRGADTSACDEDRRTPLHYAAQKNWKGVAAKLLENNANSHKRDGDGALPLNIAFDNKYDEMSALLLAYMPNYFVRNLFISGGKGASEMSMHQLLRSRMQKTILSVLDCLIETQGSTDSVRVFYNILECDEKGNTPTDPEFDPQDKSPLQIIAKQGNKTIVYHDAVRLLVRKKWKEFAKFKFQLNSIIYMLALFCLTYSLIVAVTTEDPAVYDGALQIVRGVFEVISLIMVFLTLITELNQLRRHRLEYFTDAFNWFDMISSLLLLTVPVLRFTHQTAQWHLFAFGFLFWVIRIFKFAEIFRQTGAYVQILGRVLIHDLVQFGVVFAVILLAFTGSFFLALRGDNDLETNQETSSFWSILFVGLRTLSETQPVVEYTGSTGYSTVSTMFMLMFLFTCCVILLNILIAQMTDTYQKVQQDAQRGLEVHRAWIVARVELNSFFWRKDYRTCGYTEYEDIPDLRNVLTKWDSPPLNEMNNYIRDIWDSLDNHKMNLLTIQHRMTRQENTLKNMQEKLDLLVSFQSHSSPNENTRISVRPRFYRSETENLAESQVDEDTIDNKPTPISEENNDSIIPDHIGKLSSADLNNRRISSGFETNMCIDDHMDKDHSENQPGQDELAETIDDTTAVISEEIISVQITDKNAVNQDEENDDDS